MAETSDVMVVAYGTYNTAPIRVVPKSPEVKNEYCRKRTIDC
jgi:hypothetical protein